MIITIKKVPGNECNIEVCTDSTVIYVKELVAKQLKIPVTQQKLVFKGKTLTDEMSLRDYNISEGNKIHLFAIDSTSGSQQQSTPTTNRDINRFWEQLSEVLQKYYSKGDTIKIVDDFKRNLMADIEDLSLDDIERLATLKLSQQ